MPWNDCLYRYYKEHIGQYLGSRADDAMLILTWRGRPLVVDLFRESGQYSPLYHVQARIAVTLTEPYRLTIGAKKRLSGGINTVLKIAPDEAAGFVTDLGFPEVTRNRLIRTDNKAFTKLVLDSLDFRNALRSCPEDKVEIRPGPGEDGAHLITVTTDPSISGAASDGDWYLDPDGAHGSALESAEDRARRARRVAEEFFPRMDRFLDLARTAYNAVTQWPM